MSHYVGLEVSQDLTAVCVVDEQGTITHECAVPTEPAAIMGILNNAQNGRFRKIELP